MNNNLKNNKLNIKQIKKMKHLKDNLSIHTVSLKWTYEAQVVFFYIPSNNFAK